MLQLPLDWGNILNWTASEWRVFGDAARSLGRRALDAHQIRGSVQGDVQPGVSDDRVGMVLMEKAEESAGGRCGDRHNVAAGDTIPRRRFN